MRFVLVGPVYPYRGRIAHYTTLLNQALDEQGHDVLLVSFNPLTWLASFVRIRRYRPHVWVLQWWTSFWAPVWYTLALLNRPWLRAPFVFLGHDVLPHHAYRWERWLARLTLGWGNRFVVRSEQERWRLRELLPHAIIDIVPHPVYAMFAGQQIDKTAARQWLKLPEQAPVLLFFGIVRPYKGLADLIEALPAVRQVMPELRLVMAGEFWQDKASHLARIRQLQLDEIVQVDDRYIPNKEVGLYFSAADVLVAPYRTQTGSGVIELARGFGLVVAVAGSPTDRDNSGQPGVLQHGKSRSEMLAEAIVVFLTEQADHTSPSAQVDEAASWHQVVTALEGAAG